MRLVHYQYKPEFAATVGIENTAETGNYFIDHPYFCKSIFLVLCVICACAFLISKSSMPACRRIFLLLLLLYIFYFFSIQV